MWILPKNFAETNTVLAALKPAPYFFLRPVRIFRAYRRNYLHPNLIDHLKNEEVALIINTPNGKGARTDEGRIRAAAVQHGVPCITTFQAAMAAIKAMEALRGEEMNVESLQERFSLTKPVAT
jgi:carbamoyl-phosphate synthase large subunit